MEKGKLTSAIVPIVISLICIVLAFNVAVAKSQLDAERAKAVGINAQLVELQAQLSAKDAKYDEHARIVRELQSSLDMARMDVENIRREADTLRAEKADLEAKLTEAVNVIQRPAAKVTEEIKPVTQ